MTEDEKKPAWYITDILVPIAVEVGKDLGKRLLSWVWDKAFPEKKDATN